MLDKKQKDGGHSDDSTDPDSRRDFSDVSDLRGDFDIEFLLEVYRKEHREGRGRPVQSLTPSFPRRSQARLWAGRRLGVCSTMSVSFAYGEKKACPEYNALQNASLRGLWRATWAKRLEGREPRCG
jgi:hypothetical protein